MRPTIYENDQIEIQAQGIKVRGKVAVALWWGDNLGWDIEIKEANVPRGYSRWKQRQDGGKITQLRGEAVQ